MNKEKLVLEIASLIEEYTSSIQESFVDRFLHDVIGPRDFIDFVESENLNPIIGEKKLFVRSKIDWDLETYNPTNEDWIRAYKIYARAILSDSRYLKKFIRFCKEDFEEFNFSNYPEIQKALKVFENYLPLSEIILRKGEDFMLSFLGRNVTIESFNSFIKDLKLNKGFSNKDIVFIGFLPKEKISVEDYLYLCRIYAFYICFNDLEQKFKDYI